LKLLLSYIIASFFLFVPNKGLQWIAAGISILIYLTLVSQFPIGGDYNSLQNRAINQDVDGDIPYDNIILYSINIISRFISIDTPIIFALLILLFFPFYKSHPQVFLWFLAIGYYQLVTGYQRQVLASLIFLRALNMKFFLMITVSLASIITHKSVIILVAIGKIFRSRTSMTSTFIFGLILFILLYVTGAVFDGTVVGHFTKYYFAAEMNSNGALLRVISYLISYFVLIRSQGFIRDKYCFIFETMIIFGFCTVLSGATTAGDRIAIFALTSLLFIECLPKISNLRLCMSALPIIIMTLTWVFLSDQARLNW
jgi:hypothetical protein